MASFKKSASLKIVISFVDADGAALNISGATVKFMMKVRESDPDILAIVSKQTGGGGVSITNAAGGLAEATLTASDLDAISEGGVYCEGMAVSGSEVTRTETFHFVVKQNLIKAIS